MAYSWLKVQKFILNRVYSEDGNTSLSKITRAKNHPSITKQHLQSMLGHKHINFLASVSQETCSAFIALPNVSNSLQMWKDMDQKASVPRVESHAYIS